MMRNVCFLSSEAIDLMCLVTKEFYINFGFFTGKLLQIKTQFFGKGTNKK